MKLPICVLDKDEAFEAMFQILSKIYGARNIWLSESDILAALKENDRLFRTVEYTGDIERRKELLEEAAKEIASHF